MPDPGRVVNAMVPVAGSIRDTEPASYEIAHTASLSTASPYASPPPRSITFCTRADCPEGAALVVVLLPGLGSPGSAEEQPARRTSAHSAAHRGITMPHPGPVARRAPLPRGQLSSARGQIA